MTTKKMLRKMRVKALKGITLISFVLWCLAVCSLDSDTNLPFVVLCVTTAWMTLIYCANCRR